MSALPAGYDLTGDPARIDAVAAHAYLTRSSWSSGIDLATVRRALANSLTVVVLHQGRQVAMARTVTDRATFVYLADLYTLEGHRGRGLAGAMLDWLHDHPDLRDLTRWLLFTTHEHALYRRHGWSALEYPERGMERLDEPLAK